MDTGDTVQDIRFAGSADGVRILPEVTAFLGEDRGATPPAPPAGPGSAPAVTSLLSPRELDVLRLAAQGCDNDAIAAELVLSVRTVERHLQNAYAKLGL